MKKIIYKLNKLLLIGIVISLCINFCLLPSINSEKNSDAEIIITNSDLQFEISIFGSFNVKNKNTPWNQTDGVYAEVKNIGNEVGHVDIGYELKGISTSPSHTNIREIIMEKVEIPVDTIANIGIFGGNFGIGIISFKVFLDGWGEDEGFHYEKTGYGLCFGHSIYILFQK